LRIGWPGAGAVWRRRAARLCVLVAIAGLALAAARPSVGVPATRRDGLLELVIDVSGSTQATDVAPTRLAAIQRSTLRLLDQLPPRVRVGLVAFAGTASSLTRPTTNRDAVRRKVASLRSDGPTAIGDALSAALEDLRNTGPAGAATVLLVSDGANTVGGNPTEAARAAAARHVSILAVAVGTPDGTAAITDEATGQVRQIPVPPDPAQLSTIVGATGGRAVEARSAAALDAALYRLARTAGLVGSSRELTLPFAAAALLLLAVAVALSPRRPQPADGRRLAALLATARHRAPAAVLLLASVGMVAAWARWVPAAGAPVRAAADYGSVLAALPKEPIVIASPKEPVPAPAPAPAFLSTESIAKRDKAVVGRAIDLLRRHGELAEQRQAEIRRRHLNRMEMLDLSSCDICVADALATTSTYQPASGIVGCVPRLYTGLIRKQAGRWRVPVDQLVAMVVLHEQELCLHRDDSTSLPADAERRFAEKLGHRPLFDRFYAQVSAGPRDRETLEQALAIVRDHGELAYQRRDNLRRRHLNQVEPLRIAVCRSCLGDTRIGQASADGDGGLVGCDIDIDLAGVEHDARAWGLRVTDTLAVLLAHEQEHCVRAPDYRETPAVDEEAVLARKVGKARLVQYVVTSYQNIDKSGHWKR
jgi:Ca-activated chloride channel homolog